MHQTAYEFGLLGICQIVNSFAAFGDESPTFHFWQYVRAYNLWTVHINAWSLGTVKNDFSYLHANMYKPNNWMERHLKKYVGDGPFHTSIVLRKLGLQCNFTLCWMILCVCVRSVDKCIDFSICVHMKFFWMFHKRTCFPWHRYPWAVRWESGTLFPNCHNFMPADMFFGAFKAAQARHFHCQCKRLWRKSAFSPTDCLLVNIGIAPQ